MTGGYSNHTVGDGSSEVLLSGQVVDYQLDVATGASSCGEKCWDFRRMSPTNHGSARGNSGSSETYVYTCV